MRLCFDNVELDMEAGECYRDGIKVRMQLLPFRLLVLLAQSAGFPVAYKILEAALWPDSFVDAKHSLKTAVQKLRTLLGSDLIETLPGLGYRFTQPIETKHSVPRFRPGVADRLRPQGRPRSHPERSQEDPPCTLGPSEVIQ